MPSKASKYVIAALSAVLAQVASQAQGAGFQADRPAALTHAVQALDTVAKVQVPSVDVAKARAEDEKLQQQGFPPRFAIRNPVRMTPATHGTWENLDKDTLLWRLRVTSTGAKSINLGFTRYLMPAGGRLLIYSADGEELIRPFTDLDNKDHGELWTPMVRSDSIVIELVIQANTRKILGLELGFINVGYRGFGTRTVFDADGVASVQSGSCNVDVVCPEGDDWRDQIKSVAVYSLGGGTFCTGFMVNNTALDQTPYFMTANHCGVNSGNDSSLVVFWNYENSTCRPPGSPSSGGPGDGSLSQFQTGSTHRASYSASDFTLVEMDDAPNPAWEVVFAGWDNTSADPPAAIAIHHPNTDEKRISFENDPTFTTTYLQNAVPGNGTHIRIIDWDLGTTEPGSSGSPLFNPDHRIVGQLHGGFASCSGQTSDWYGRVSVSWTGGGTNSSRLSNWLDPGNTGATVLDHLGGGGLQVAPGGDALHIGDVGGPFTSPTVTYTLSNPSSTPVDYSVSLTSSFGILLDGAAAPVTGTLAASGGTIDVVVTLGPAINALVAGLYVETIVFDDITNAQSETREHTLEIGFTNFTVDPGTGLQSGGPLGGPFAGSVVYTITSERPSPVAIEVAASDPWISINGGAGPVTINLNGTGTSDTVTVAIDPSANALSAGLYNGSVTFTNLSNGGGDTTRPVTLDVGRVLYPSTDTPLAINDNSTIESVISIPDDYCIGDVNVDVDITHTYTGDLIIQLVSPTGIVVRLHDRTGGTTNDILQTYDDEGLQPDGPGLLADFDFEPVMGDWTLIVSDNANGDIGTLNAWGLRIVPTPGDCPAPIVAYSFPLDTDPGWSVEGQWAFGQPTGGGSGAGDPTSGSTGTNVYGYNLSGDYPNNMASTLYLTTISLNCANLSNTRLKFQRWLGVESSSFDNAIVEISSNGVDWSTVWEHTATSTLNESTWSLQSYSISGVADGEPSVLIRWGMGPTDGSSTYPGWNIDDIEITGIPGIQDCNNNAVPDDEDITLGSSDDCNGNGIPDECEIDVSSTAPNGPFFCTPASPPVGLSNCDPDCNDTGIPDACDIGTVSQDCNGNNVPDECEQDCNGNGTTDDCDCTTAGGAAPLPETVAIAKSRYLTFDTSNVGCFAAIQITLTNSTQFPGAVGSSWWVGMPSDYCENSSQTIPPPEGCGPAGGGPSTYRRAALGCAPLCMDWSGVGVVSVASEHVVPDAEYEVRAVDCGCNLLDPSDYSSPLGIATSRWSDVCGPDATGVCASGPDGVVDLPNDVLGIVEKFRNSGGTLSTTRTDMRATVASNNGVDSLITVADFTAALEAFQGGGFTFAGPVSCPAARQSTMAPRTVPGSGK